MSNKEIGENTLRELNKMRHDRDRLLFELQNIEDPSKREQLRKDIVFLGDAIESMEKSL